ncbi:hypothetical protein Ga0100231_004930 [Opitutaceae bacterium TAV4]|nr:hypothetical protein Ga0100231_004930 [Opitutaceae bacterium TAV4]RRK02339.1 hypothetical protein Ga0100230_004075 [Opitutaceae bacterium TAV3]
MKSLINLIGFLYLLVMTAGVSLMLADEFDDILGAETPDIVAVLEAEEDEDAPWTPPPPYVLPPALLPALKDLPIPPGFTAVQFDQLRIALTSALRNEIALTPTGLVVLTPPVLTDPLKSLERWLRIARAADITELPAYAHGTPAWVMWKKLSSSPLTTEAEWVRFYQRLKA